MGAKACAARSSVPSTPLQEAFDAVKRNKGSAGIDRRSITETELRWQQHEAEIE